MQTTPNNNIKIVRLQSGEDVMANIIEDEETDTIFLDNPMHIIFKRIPTGQTVMMMMPWLPIEIIKENTATLYATDVLTMIEPKDDLIEYYGGVVLEAQQRMIEKRNFEYSEEDEEDDEDYSDDIIDAMNEKIKGNIH